MIESGNQETRKLQDKIFSFGRWVVSRPTRFTVSRTVAKFNS